MSFSGDGSLLTGIESGQWTTNATGIEYTGDVSVVGGDLDVAGSTTGHEQSADPEDPDEGAYAIWLSDGTDSGDDGDVLIKITAGGTTKTATLIDFSAQ